MSTLHHSSPRDATWIGLSLSLLFPAVLVFALRPLMGTQNAWMGPLMMWVVVSVLVLKVLPAENLPLSSIGWQGFSLKSVGLGVAFGLLMMLAFPLLQWVYKQMGWEGSAGGLARILQQPVALRVIIVLTAGMLEEVLFRGYAIERLASLMGSRGWAALVSLLVFTGVHLGSWAPSHLISVFVVGGLLTLLYLWRRNLLICIVAHTVVDAVGVLAASLRP
ncbi:CPBP family intramembrane metalloprotease [Paucibacter sp. TC2R-5]|uniref:CPBP family intramembrane glutamic endopeptidase n=1 Tax=Paucibacter sp. TC2R-5 TaxID=2893555 RepID=UPI0021E4DC64|nr:type II CAAX endopeptidase family protein [Paucibacter sp. TC2R-5]MCV2361310.1 CPBP family intramembrane metalloprotease [Paucibacter sp. TC2R-5]